MPFLDTLLDRNNNNLSVSVYRKPTHSNRFVHFSSCQPPGQKFGIINTLCRRAYQISSSAMARNNEYQTLSTAFQQCAYPKNSIAKYMNPIGVSKQPDDPTKSKCVIPFIPGLSSHLGGFLKRWNISIGFSKQQTLGHLLYKRSPETEYYDQQNVVYKVKCSGCDKCYIGQSRQIVKCRLKEHKDAVRLHKRENAIAVHTLDSGHWVDPFDAAIIAKENRYDLLLAKESLFIDASKTINLTTGCANKSLVQLISQSRDT